MALWRQRADDIVRVYVTEARLPECGPLLRWCAQRKKAYHIVTAADLEKIAGSVHHEGLALLAKAPELLDDHQLLDAVAELAPGPQILIYLDGVQNPHNVGSITRVAAHFGAPLIIGRERQLPRLSPSAARVAAGGAEFVRWASLKRPEATLRRVLAGAADGQDSAGFTMIATSSHGQASLFAEPLPARVLLVFGGESTGASQTLMAAAHRIVTIPGTAAVESLNVAVAAGLLLGEHWRQHRSHS